MDGKLVDVYVLKRPWCDHFMENVCARFEVVIFTASLAKYADPLLDLLDKQRMVRWRLFRESCFPYEGNYVKDLSCLGRDLSQTIIGEKVTKAVHDAMSDGPCREWMVLLVAHALEPIRDVTKPVTF